LLEVHEHLPFAFRDKLVVLIAALAWDGNHAGMLRRLWGASR